jgi:glycosyltransferase involved in cell wall biosynthesis
MRIHSVCVVKNESDIVGQSLTAAAEWSDLIYVLDNGSTDGTWEKVLDLSCRLRQVVPFRREDGPFDNKLRAEVFGHYRRQSLPGDWWCKLDADEFYIDSPREFLARVPAPYDNVWSASFQYYLTEKDMVRFSENPAIYGDDVPVGQKCRYYLNNWSELRFFKYSDRITWSAYQPDSLMRAYPQRIRLKHYQYRSPQQIERRLLTRKPAMQRGVAFAHEASCNWADRILGQRGDSHGSERRTGSNLRFPVSWTDRLVDSSKLRYDDGSNYVITEDLLPKIRNPRFPLLSRMKHRLYSARAVIRPNH